MKSLTILYDDSCELCIRSARWLRRQPAYCNLWVIPARVAADRFPALFPLGTRSPRAEIVAVTDAGDVYRGDAAWIMALYALRDYRALSFTLARPRWRPITRRAIQLLGRGRHSISSLLLQLSAAPATPPECPIGACVLAPVESTPATKSLDRLSTVVHQLRSEQG